MVKRASTSSASYRTNGCSRTARQEYSQNSRTLDNSRQEILKMLRITQGKVSWLLRHSSFQLSQYWSQALISTSLGVRTNAKPKSGNFAKKLAQAQNT